jgi:segregation and condensation protein A
MANQSDPKVHKKGAAQVWAENRPGKPGHLAFDDGPAIDRDGDEPGLMIDIDGYEGPLDLLLELARRQKVDLAKISILALAEQYLIFVETARTKRLELAADYLVMAAWLAYLKSRLLLPEPPKGEEPSASDLATALALRLKRLEAMREVSRWLGSQAQLGRDVFARGNPEKVNVTVEPLWQDNLYDLLSAYARQRVARQPVRMQLHQRQVWSLASARDALERLVGFAVQWTSLDEYLISYAVEPAMRATVRASSLSAMLEMVREGTLDLRQDGAFQPIYVRKRSELPPEPVLPIAGMG